MFTGIVEGLGRIVHIREEGSNRIFKMECDWMHELRIDQSVAHNGICLTVMAMDESGYEVCAIQETLKKTNAMNWSVGDKVNLERCMVMNGRLDGHIMQGHVDECATCLQVVEEKGSWVYRFAINPKHAHLLVEKGSVAINGTSLTCFNVTDNSFEVAIIPYTYEHTTIHRVVAGSQVNIEYDIIGKYVSRMQGLKGG